MEKEILKRKKLKNIKRENFMSCMQRLCLLLLIISVSLFRTGNFPLILVPEIVRSRAVGLFSRMDFMNHLTDRALLSELAARNLRVRFVVHLHQLDRISRHTFYLLIPRFFHHFILSTFLLFSYYLLSIYLDFFLLKKSKLYSMYFEQ